MHEGLRRAFWPALVIAAFCLPLLVGLGAADQENDEAIYSFAVGSILDLGDWLNPRSSPQLDTVFLEKPPLKFWLVAAPIRLGLLPHDDAGLRVMDALMGGIAFLYVLGIGWRLAGPLCGAVGVLVLFVYEPLLFHHGIRGNNMEAALLLAYCGGVYHWLAWAAAEGPARRAAHVLALGLFFYLGLMTKFVAVLFLPLVLGLATLLDGPSRRRLRQEPRPWLLGLGLVAVLAAPWFIYQHYAAGHVFWRVIVGEHVLTRFTTGVDPAHLQPWDFYAVEVFTTLRRAGAMPLVLAGLVLMLGRVAASRWLEGAVVLAWFLVPLAVMSALASKLHHYVYPFLPPLALAAGYAVAWLVRRLEPAARRGARWLTARVPVAVRTRPVSRWVLTGFALSAAALALVTLLAGPVRLTVPGVGVLRNSGIERPLLVAVVLLLAAGRVQAVLVSAAIGLVLLITPLDAYRRTTARLSVPASPLRATRDCLLGVATSEARAGRPVRPVYAVNPERWFLHPYFYYFRHAGGWEEVERVEDHALAMALGEQPRPVLIDSDDYSAFEARRGRPRPTPMMVTTERALLVLPEPYAACGLAYLRHAND